MATKKLRNFEYAIHKQDYKGGEQIREAGGAYKTLNGYALVLCSGYSSDLKDTTAAELALERVSYYLNNEFLEEPVEAVHNALVYASGFLFEYARKNEGYEGMKTACLCVLIRDNKVYYANIGGNGLYFFNGKKLYALACDSYSENEEPYLLGESATITPYACEHPFIPVDDDILLLCSERFLNNVPEKSVKSILSDPMPLLTKVSRLVDLTAGTEDEGNISLHLATFYNIENKERSFAHPKEAIQPNKTEDNDSLKLPKIIKHPIGNMVILGVIVLFFFYMVYDLFLKDSAPSQRVVSTRETDTTEIEEAHKQEEAKAASFVIPNDTIYVVRGGDTWGRIYQQFEVCSWFIRSHKPNAGKFDRANNPVAGTRINIPLIYSSNQKLNPDFYNEFTTDNVGGTCQNVNERFLNAFEKKKQEKLDSQ